MTDDLRPGDGSRARRRRGAAAAGALSPAVGTGVAPAAGEPTSTAPPARPSLLRCRAALALGGLAATVALPLGVASASDDSTSTYVVRGGSSALAGALDAVRRAGGDVTGSLPLVGGVVAELSDREAAQVALDGAVAAVTPDAALQLVPGAPSATATAAAEAAAVPAPATPTAETYDPDTDPYALRRSMEIGGIPDAWARGATGRGVRVAVIDSGVTTVPGLDSSGKVVRGVDMSIEAVSEDKAHYDGYGHGTHLSGIVAGDDGSRASTQSFTGVAPDASVLSVKVGNAAGQVDVSQVLAAIDWTVATRQLTGVRVINLAFNARGVQNYTLDPLSFAVEQAWKAGIVVVVSAGNDGSLGRLQSPAQTPWVLAVGALDDKGTATPGDDEVPSYSSRGDGVRNPDVIAPGRSVQSLVSPGSYAAAKGKRLGDRFVRASGTSQSTAYVSGVVALLLSQRPDLTPDQVKALLRSTARPLSGVSELAQGSGAVDVLRALSASKPGRAAVQKHAPSTGLGSLSATRGSDPVVVAGRLLTGETTAWGTVHDPAAFVASMRSAVTDPLGTVGKVADAAGRTAGGLLGGVVGGAERAATGDLNGAQWNGAQWNGAQWNGAQWNGAQWNGAQWNGAQWNGAQWNGAQWNGAQWNGAQWNGAQWNGAQWNSSSWSSSGFSGIYWL